MAHPTRPRALLFDLYNTLIDIATDERDPEVWRNLAHFLRYQGLVTDPVALHDSFFALARTMVRESTEPHAEVDLPGAFGQLLHELGYRGPEQFSLQVAQLFRALSMRRFALFPDVIPALTALRPRFRLAVISDAQRAFLDHETQLLGLGPFLDMRIASGDYGFRKPDVRLFKIALAALDVHPLETVYIGDHPYRDICGARAAGIRAVLIQRDGRAGVDTRACTPDLVVTGLDQLTTWLRDTGTAR
jgi:putative hydrolase of the HAD superfamily